MKAPNPSIERCAYLSSTPAEPPLLPNIAWKERVRMNHGCSSCPRLPSGFSRLCSGPAPKPSSETEKPVTRTFVITKSLPSLSASRIEAVWVVTWLMTMCGAHQYLSSTHITPEHSKPADSRLFYSRSLPLDGAGGFGGDVVDHPIDAAHLVDDAGGGAAEDLVRERVVVGGHAVGRGDGPQRADEFIRARIAHDADRLHRQQHGEGLPDRVVESGIADLFEEHRIGLAQDVELVARDLARDADREARAGERVAVDKIFGQAELAAEGADLVLEQFAQGLDERQLHARGEAADIVMRLDRHRRAARRADRFDDIGVAGSLRQEFDTADPVRLLVEHIDKGGADRLALMLGIGDPGELLEEQRARVAVHERDVVVTAEQGDDLLGLAEAQQSGIDKDAGQRVTDRLVQEGRGNRGIDAAREAADDASPFNLGADAFDRLGAERRHRPVAGAAAHLVCKVL